mgnify:CR=1 FL=1
MKINFTTAEIHSLLQESFLFREKVLSLLNVYSLEYYREQIRAKFPLFASTEKISAIKWLREETKNKTENFESEGFDSHEVHDYSNNTKNQFLGLAAAKKFVESC